MKIAIGQINTQIGDFSGTFRKIEKSVAHAISQKCELLIFPEMTATGYTPRDLLERASFIEENLRIVEQAALLSTEKLAIILGAVTPNEKNHGRALFNSAYFLRDGKVIGVQHKSLLPTYDVFDESRYFEPAREAAVFRHHRRTIGLMICEDLWNAVEVGGRRLYRVDPTRRLVRLGADLIVNISASPFVVGKYSQRQRLLSESASHYGVEMIYANLVGGNDQLIFDGGSMAADRKGRLIGCARRFKEEELILDLSQKKKKMPPEKTWSDEEEIYEALLLGLRDYLEKTGFKRVLIGLSGGIDSAVVAAIAVAALGSKRVMGVAMPSRYSTAESVEDARQLAQNLKIAFYVKSIEPLYREYRILLSGKDGEALPDVTDENIQARIRGNMLMAISNRSDAIVLSTGNKSELAVGYCTLYGDMVGGLAVISDLPKMSVYKLANYINRKKEVIPRRIITKAPSAELRPDQKDSDSLPDYEILDGIVSAYVENHLSEKSIMAMGYSGELVKRVIKMVNGNEYKRRQAAPGFKVSNKAFGIGRRYPISWKY